VGDRYFVGVNWMPEKVKVIYDGVDVGLFHPGRKGEKIRNSLGITKRELLVGNVARYSKVKGLPYFMETLGKLMGRDSRVRGLVVGRVKSESLYRKLLEWLVENDLEARVALWKHQAHIEDVLAALDIVVLASLGSEGSSRVALEAGASGKPLVATTVGALPEIVVEGETGFLVPAGDGEALARELGKALSPLVRKRMGLNARKRVAETFTKEETVDKVEKLYRGITGREKF
jgi:glycosyltransferase involved in cell wall biosynthesis